ncbi:uncharacterized protein LOC8044016 isoform X2 [Ixodes scapularis]|uniref:uncharacterized protein LOC8044016 isoform X2 n=1 Tax=Ixodes scapularis TaxID=6945 RepID=UPI001A9F1F6B|nr:uncharacterized protein LOC8044016 isoform X2 [Ixodes scapularis]
MLNNADEEALASLDVLLGRRSCDGGDKNLQAKIRAVMNAVAKLPKSNLETVPFPKVACTLLEHISLEARNLDVGLLAGTCVFRLLSRFLSPLATAQAVEDLILRPSCHSNYPRAPCADQTFPGKVCEHTKSIEWDGLEYPTHYHLCLIHGALSCGPDVRFILTRHESRSRKRPLILEFLPFLVFFAHSCGESHFHVLATLVLWLNTVENLLTTKVGVVDLVSLKDCESSQKNLALSDGLHGAADSSSETSVITGPLPEVPSKIQGECLGVDVFTPGSKQVDLILSVCDLFWESSISGVPELVRKAFLSLLRLGCLKEHRNDEGKFSEVPELHKFLLKRTMQLDWRTKPKFLSLYCLLKFVPFEVCLEMDPEFTRKAICGLQANHLVSSAADVYKASLEGGSANSASKEFWRDHWKDVIVRTIKYCDRACLQNLVTHILPWTVANVPGSFDELRADLEGCRSEGALVALVALMRIAKQAGSFSPTAEEELIAKCLKHESNIVRAEVFSLLCSCHFKSKLPNRQELQGVCEFLEHNLNIDDAWFRTRVTVQLDNLVVRLRECLLTQYVRSKQSDLKKRVALDDSFYHTLDIMGGIVSQSVSHLFPGASYQRAVTCLHILDAVFGTFCRAPTGKRRTIHKEADLDAFLRQEANGRLQLGSARMRTALLHCLFHSVEEIRLKAFSLLTNEASHFLESGGVVHEELWSLARRHLSSPRPQDGAIGALLVRLSLVCLKQVSDAEMTSRLLEVCDQAVTNFVALQRDIASSSADCPIHGWLLTLTTCLSDVEGILKAVERHSSLTGVDYGGTILNEALSLSQSVLQYVLRIMVPRDQHNVAEETATQPLHRVAPSFEDTERAFLALVENSKRARRTTFTEEERQLAIERITSCCWLGIKNGCLLLEQVARISLGANGVSYPLDYSSLKGIMDTFVSVMTACRHRGAIESCAESLRRFCQLVSSCDDASTAEMPLAVLSEALKHWSEKKSRSSLTRRSAGLPLLVKALIEGDRKDAQSSLRRAVLSVTRLFPARTGHLTPDNNLDVPAAEKLHLLCALAGSSPLGEAMRVHHNAVFEACLEGLDSSVWVVKNAAYQLYGTVAPRMLGQKRTREEFAGHDTLTPMKVFTQFPCVMAALSGFGERPRGDSEQLFFILDFLSRLRPASHDQNDRTVLFDMDKCDIYTSSTREKLEPFVAVVRTQLKSRSWKLRLLAARCLASLCHSPQDEVLSALSALASSGETTSYNELQARLRAANVLLRVDPNCIPAVVDCFADDAVLNWWVLASRNCFVQMELLDTLSLLYPDPNHAWKSDLCEALLKKLEGFAAGGTSAPGHSRPGHELLRKRQAAWLLSTATRHRSPDLTPVVTSLMRVAKAESHVMEALLESLGDACRTDSMFSVGVWRQLATELVAYAKSGAHHRTHLADTVELLESLLQKQDVPNPTLVRECLSVSQHYALGQSAGGTTVRALSLALWSQCLRLSLENPAFGTPATLGESVHAWLSSLAAALEGRPEAETTADIVWFQVARSVRTTGHAAFNWASRCDPPDHVVLQSVFDITLQLLQDGDPRIRSEAAAAFTYEARALQPSPVQPNLAVRDLFKRMVQVCRGQLEVVRFLMDKLHACDSSTHLEVERQLGTPDFSTSGLFEQDESEVFFEPMVTLFLFRDHLKVSSLLLILLSLKTTALIRIRGLVRGTQVAVDDSKICYGTELEALFSEEESKLLGELKETCAVLEAFLGQSGERELQLYGKPKLHYVLTALLCRVDVTAHVLKDRFEAEGTAGTLQVHRRRLMQLWTPPAF